MNETFLIDWWRQATQEFRWPSFINRDDLKLFLMVLVVSFFLATVMSQLLGWWLMPVFGKVEARRGQASVSHPLQIQGPVSLLPQDIAVIKERNLFKAEMDDELVGSETTKPLSDKPVPTQLPLQVLGIIFGGTPYTGLATILNKKDAKINSFVVGDMLLDGAVVKEIWRRKVIIDNKGRLEYIELEDKEIIRSRRDRRANPEPDNTYGQIAPIAKAPPPDSYSEEGFERKQGKIRMTEAYKKRLLTDELAKVLQDAKADPNILPTGEIHGFKLTKIRENSIWYKAGFQNGDIVLEINGVQLQNAAAALGLLRSLQNERQIDVLVERNGVQIPMSLTIE